ncbi:hypothetical protein KFK09_024297 [Dendrobium nobile]|uniref:Uncharacterized protein n=1 Tax=Dendrobium nobile TaxID=94219 RepID=A0A8T3AC98_DENNO|nr:hypothetical protein KFK09_024297 [Dendrobium nobile]
MERRSSICVSLLSLLSFLLLPASARLDPVLRLPSEISGRRLEAGGDDSVGTRWAILIAGSSGYGNYRHQVFCPFPCFFWVWLI